MAFFYLVFSLPLLIRIACCMSRFHFFFITFIVELIAVSSCYYTLVECSRHLNLIEFEPQFPALIEAFLFYNNIIQNILIEGRSLACINRVIN